MNAQVFNLKKEIISEFDLPSFISEYTLDVSFLSKMFKLGKKVHCAERKSSTKTRSEVSHSTKKQYKQKGTGKARRSTDVAPQFTGGGVSGGPQPAMRNFKVNKRESALLKKQIIASKLENNNLFFIDNISLPSISTKSAINTFNNFGNTVLIVHQDNLSHNELLSTRNLRSVKYVSLDMLTSFDLMSFNTLLLHFDLIKNNTLFNNLYARY